VKSKSYGWLYENPHRYTTPNAPLLIGKIAIDEEQLVYLLERLQEYKEAFLNCAARYSSEERSLELMLSVPNDDEQLS